MTEAKKLPVMTNQAGALDEAVMAEMDGLPERLPDEYRNDPNLPAEFKAPGKLKSAVEAKLGVPVKKVVYAPVGQMLRDSAEQFLEEHDHDFLARLREYR